MVDEEAKTESMTVSIKASNQDFSYSAQYALTYSVEEGAWVLTNLEKSGEEYTAQALATEEEAEAVLNEKYDTYSYISQEGKENRCKFCYNKIYNCKPLSLLSVKKEVDRILPSAIRLDFTLESVKEVTEILTKFIQAYQKGILFSEEPFAFTRGHLKRGIE